MIVTEFLAHSGGALGEPERLALHLTRVADRAERFGQRLGLAAEARAAGLLHDLGKYSELFLRRLQGQERGLDHWSGGAAVALRRLGPASPMIALAILGHHVGLGTQHDLELLRRPEDLVAKLRGEGRRLTEVSFDRLLERFAADGLSLPEPPQLRGGLSHIDLALEIRLLFSALVDADFLETEAHFEGSPRAEGAALDPERTLAVVQARIAELGLRGRGRAEVQRLRADLAEACLAAAEEDPGLFTLTAPTGAGKTLAMLAFALRHAALHGLRRVVVAIPYLSIAEQTARVYREVLAPVFGPHYVLEHHSLAEPGEEKSPANEDSEQPAHRLGRQLAENWDAPLVVTTNVQVLESLFAHKPARCRKLHNLAGSVLLFDEAQALPAELAIPTLAALARFSARFGSTIVFATATQPAFDHLHDRVRELTSTGWRPREIVPPALALFDRARRVRFAWELDRAATWREVADRLAARSQCLAIVNLKRHAQVLAAAVADRAGHEGLFHLSTNLCPAHREAVLDEVRRRLSVGEPCRVVATQCVEAGVDLDFPAVFRALGPLEAIAQAAGRCNRNGVGPEPGEVVVFLPEEAKYPGGAYDQAARVTEALWREAGDEIDLDEPATFRRYFERLYDLTGQALRWERKLSDPLKALDFPEMATAYRLIEKDAVNVLVPYDPETFMGLRAGVQEAGRPTRRWVRRARRHAVALYRSEAEGKAGIANYLVPVPLGLGATASDWTIYVGEAYDRQLFGLQEAEEAWIG